MCKDGEKVPFIFINARNRMCLFLSLTFSSSSVSTLFSFSIDVFLSGVRGIRSNYGILTVLKSPDPPKILQGDYMVTTEDREIELECVSENGKPAAEVQTHTQNRERKKHITDSKLYI